MLRFTSKAIASVPVINSRVLGSPNRIVDIEASDFETFWMLFPYTLTDSIKVAVPQSTKAQRLYHRNPSQSGHHDSSVTQNVKTVYRISLAKKFRIEYQGVINERNSRNASYNE